MLNRMADYREKQGAVAKKIGGALAYPMMVLGVGMVVVVILMTVVMPQLIGMFTAMNVELPLPTRILIAMTNFVTNNTLYLVVAVAYDWSPHPYGGASPFLPNHVGAGWCWTEFAGNNGVDTPIQQ
ncbi:hypothetical protein ES703_99001 [subsurface metagenome]